MKFSIAIHGGAGTITRALMTPEKELAYTAGLDAALACGEAILKAGGTALDAVQAAVVDLENNHLFNAGRGSVFTNKGTHEMDAALMCGATLNAGAVAGIHSVKNPIALCRTVMDKSGHVFLAGQQAVDFAKLQGLELKEEAYFKDDFRYNQWLEVKDQEVYQLDHSGDKKFGTVGAVASDSRGNLAAATSTGGMTNKRWGRIGDSPVIGAGTYANNNSVAISCTGHGEYFIRAVVAYDIACLMEYAGMTLEQACEKVVMDKLVKMGGEGGLIAIDNRGNICLPFNSEGMYRASATESGREVRIYRE
ncbi:MAG: isoaspartyl peptidase/L-asparaginase family protein [Flavobacteriales bacterium]